mmetsp:Transcript_10974/g.26519  ORF Transcript_10974/g.26519 Transcript_10974/m.26519 type:complete len:210 (-) Transcript_10974:1274-1903(-)
MMSDSAFSYAREIAGTISVPKSMHRMRIVVSGRGIDKMIKIRNGVISGMFEDKVYAIDFFRLSKISRPSSTPLTIELKLSSRRIMSAASLETSEPAIPMATPILAFFKAGESLTPSPVTATILPRRWQFSTIINFCWGEVRANTICSCASTRFQSSSSRSLIWDPGTTIALMPERSTCSTGMPRSFAMSSAVGSRMIFTDLAMDFAVAG